MYSIYRPTRHRPRAPLGIHLQNITQINTFWPRRESKWAQRDARELQRDTKSCMTTKTSFSYVGEVVGPFAYLCPGAHCLIIRPWHNTFRIYFAVECTIKSFCTTNKHNRGRMTTKRHKTETKITTTTKSVLLPCRRGVGAFCKSVPRGPLSHSPPMPVHQVIS